MRRATFIGFCLCALGVGLAAGCVKPKPKPPPPVPVTGKVVFANGKPVANMVISFHPQDEVIAASRPSAALDKNGKYAMDAPPGRYKATLAPIPSQAGSAGSADLPAPKKGDPKEGFNLLSGYRDAKTSQLEVTVPEHGGELSPLTVK